VAQSWATSKCIRMPNICISKNWWGWLAPTPNLPSLIGFAKSGWDINHTTRLNHIHQRLHHVNRIHQSFHQSQTIYIYIMLQPYAKNGRPTGSTPRSTLSPLPLPSRQPFGLGCDLGPPPYLLKCCVRYRAWPYEQGIFSRQIPMN
jgi:hypothetical protein